jgi:hypothetical protein
MNFRTWQPGVPNSERVTPVPADPPYQHAIEVEPSYDLTDIAANPGFFLLGWGGRNRYLYSRAGMTGSRSL